MNLRMGARHQDASLADDLRVAPAAEPLKIHAGLLAHNTVVNLIGQGLPLLVGLFAVPVIVRGMGTERFGLLALCWVVLGYFGMFDLGLGRATTKAVADVLGRGETKQLPALVGTSLLLHAVFGLAGAITMAALTPLLVEHVFKIEPALLSEGKIALLILAAAVPVIVSIAVLRGVLEAGQRFDMVNWVRAPANSLVFLLPMFSVMFFNFRLPGIVLLIALSRLLSALAYLVLCYRTFPTLRQALHIDWGLVRPLLAFGGWVTVTNVIAPVITYLDRFLISSILSMTAVAYYSAPYELVTRLWILPWSLVSTLFPAFTVLNSNGAVEELERVYARSIKAIVLILGPLVTVFILFSQTILRLWLGGDFANHSAPVLQLLSVGVLLVAIANVPFTILQSLGRPDVPAKFHMIEMPLYSVLAWWLIRRMGIHGAALAWTIVMATDALLLLIACWKLFSLSPRVISNGLFRAWVALGLPALLALLARHSFVGLGVLADLVLAALLLTGFVVLTWIYVLDAIDKSTLNAAVSRLAGVLVRQR